MNIWVRDFQYFVNFVSQCSAKKFQNSCFSLIFDLKFDFAMSISWIFWNFGHLGIWASGHLGIWASGHLGIWASGHLGIWAPGLLSVHQSRTTLYRGQTGNLAEFFGGLRLRNEDLKIEYLNELNEQHQGQHQNKCVDNICIQCNIDKNRNSPAEL